MKMIFKKAAICFAGLMVSVTAFAQEIHVKVINQTVNKGNYSMKIGNGADLSKDIKSLQTVLFNYDVPLRNSASDIGVYQFFSINDDNNSECASVVANNHDASKIIRQHYKNLLVTIGGEHGNDCSFTLQYS